MFRVTHVRRDEFNNISHVLLDSGDMLNYIQAFDLAREGVLDGIVDAADELGRPTIESAYEDDFENDLAYMPSF